MNRHHDSPIMRMAFHANAADPAEPLTLLSASRYLHEADTAAGRPRRPGAVSRMLADLRSRLSSTQKPRR